MSNSFSLSGRRALITGASSGLGPAIARVLDEAGASIVIHYHHNQDGAEALQESLTQAAEMVQADLGNAAEVSQLFDAATRTAPIDILVNCAAAESQNTSDLAAMTGDRWSTTMQTNVEAPMMLIQRFAAQDNRGAVINITSIEGSRPAPGHSHYSTSKAALEMLTKAAALEFGPKGVRVNAVAPGLIWREGIEEGWPEGVNAWKSAAPLGKLVVADDIAQTVRFLACDASNSMTGAVLTVDCGLSIKPGW